MLGRCSASLRARTAILLVVLSVSCTTACTTTDEKSGDGPGQQFSGANCGLDVEIAAPPERAVTLEQSSTETLLSLGAADRIAGTAFLKSKIAPQYAEDYSSVPVLSDDQLTAEGLREATPDFVYASFGAKFSRDGVGTREELADLGVPTYVSNVDCPKKGQDAFDALATDLSELGDIFDLRNEAAELVAEQKDVLADAEKVQERTDGLSVVYIYAVFEGAPFVAGGSGIPQAISDTTGVVNVFADVDEAWPQVPWEQVAARDPDVIVLGDLTERGEPGDSAAEKLDVMQAEAAVSNLTALRKDHVIELPAIELDASVRSHHAVQTFVEGLTTLGLVE